MNTKIGGYITVGRQLSFQDPLTGGNLVINSETINTH